MAHLIDKSALVAEVESKFQKYWEKGEESDALQDGNAKYWGGVLSCLNEVKTLIDTLEVKEVDLEGKQEYLSMYSFPLFMEMEGCQRRLLKKLEVFINQIYEEVLKRFKNLKK